MPARKAFPKFKRSGSFSEDETRSDDDKSRPSRGRPFHRMKGRKSRSNSRSSVSSEDSHVTEDKPLPPPVLVYHESARDIVFRDHLRRATISRANSCVSNPRAIAEQAHEDKATTSTDNNNSDKPQVVIANFQPIIQPLPTLKLGPQDRFKELEESSMFEEDHGEDWTDAEREVVQMLKEERAVVKTIRNADWSSFLHRFRTPEEPQRGYHGSHADKPPKDDVFRFNSYVTSTTLLPEYGKKMRCYGSTKEYTTGVVFALPTSWGGETAARRTKTWSWPVGYSAKTEFNIDRQGNLINGREEALVPLSGLRRNNHAYVHDKDYKILGRMVKGGLNTVPFNEVYVRVGGLGRIVNETDVATGEERSDRSGTGRSFDNGIGLPVAIFVRTAFYGNLISLLRTRARIASNLGEKNIAGMPLLLITPELGVRVLTDRLQKQLVQVMSRSLNPFQNPHVAWKTTFDNTSERHLQQKREELIDLDSDAIRQTLTPEERARLAGGFGATDDSVANLLMQALKRDKSHHGSEESDDEAGHELQDVVNEGLAAAVRSGDYHTSRQLLILYTLVASRGHQQDGTHPEGGDKETNYEDGGEFFDEMKSKRRQSELSSEKEILEMEADEEDHTVSNRPLFAPPPPPPPLDTDRLRSATNSDGLLAVLGAAQVLKSLQDGTAKRRVEEAVDAIEEWIEHGEQSVAFRLKSWSDQRAAQSDLKIAMEDDSNFLAFVSNKAISNRKNFAKGLKETVVATDFQSLSFLQGIHEMVSKMHSPCLRLELLQYVLGLDNRYSVAHLARSIELAATCLSISSDADVEKQKAHAFLRGESI